jgi:hypothetical protein
MMGMQMHLVLGPRVLDRFGFRRTLIVGALVGAAAFLAPARSRASIMPWSCRL